jgi:hypothetical protein
MMYGFLYDSTFAMYKRQKIGPRYLDVYVITSLAAMEFVNALTIITLLAYVNVRSARELFFNGASGEVSIFIAVLLLVLNYAYVRPRRHLHEVKVTAGSRLPWVASAYMVLSVVVAIYASTLVSTFKR